MSKYCGNCGMENENGAKFCHGCGAPLTGQEKHAAGAAISNALNTAMSQNVQNAGEFQDRQDAAAAQNLQSMAAAQNLQNAAASLKKLPKQVLAGAAVAGVLLIAGGGMMISSRNTINLNRYLTVDVEGYDGYGQVTANIDWDAIEKKYGSRLSFTKKAKKELGDTLKYVEPMDVLENSVYVEIDNYSGLSNDDTITYTWDIADDIAEAVDCKIKAKDGEKKVSGLEEVEKFDAFADLEVSFTGRDGNGSPELTYNGSGLSVGAFQVSKTEGLSNGDQVTVSIPESRVEECAEELGRVPQEQKKEYTVAGLAYYLKDASAISEASMTMMQQQAEDVYRAKAAKDWDDGQTLENLTYMGNYLLTSKNSQDNHLFLVYKAQVHNSYTNDEGSSYDGALDVYWYIRYDNLLSDEAGNLEVDVTKYETPDSYIQLDSGVSSGWWNTKTWKYYGYENLEDLYKGVVTVNLDSYNHQDNI